jgi:hypothetical protein
MPTTASERSVRDLPWSEFRTTGHIEVYRVKCPGRMKRTGFVGFGEAGFNIAKGLRKY